MTVTLESLAAQMRELEDQVATLRRQVDQRAAADERLLQEITGHAKPGESFTAADMIDAATLDVDVRDTVNAVAPPGRWQALKLGKAFARLQGRRVGDFVFRRLGDDREGAAWGFVRE